jgi:hypothetical protein
VCVEAVGYLLEELRNPETLANFKKVVSPPASLITTYPACALLMYPKRVASVLLIVVLLRYWLPQCVAGVLLMSCYVWQDVESANIFIGSLIFVQELAEKVVEVRT